jgi:hypothetical protein
MCVIRGTNKVQDRGILHQRQRDLVIHSMEISNCTCCYLMYSASCFNTPIPTEFHNSRRVLLSSQAYMTPPL